MNRFIVLGGALVAALGGLYACATAVKLPYRAVSAATVDGGPSGCVQIAGADVDRLCIDDDPRGRGARVSLRPTDGTVQCIRVARPGASGLAYAEASDDADRAELELAPAAGYAAFVVSGLRRISTGDGPFVTLSDPPVEIQAYERPCWQVCRTSVGGTTIRLGGSAGNAITVTKNEEPPPCPVLGPSSVVIPRDAGTGERHADGGR